MAKGGGNEEAEKAREAEERRQEEIRAGTKTVNRVFDRNFDKKFFNDRQRDYIGFARPQLDDQFAGASSQLGFDMARRGLVDSSVRGAKSAELQKLFDLELQDIRSDAVGKRTDAMNAVEDARGNVINNLQITGDQVGARRAALDRADALSQPDDYSPLEDLFLQFTSGLGTQAGLERAYAAGSPIKPRYNLGLYGGNSVKVTR